jgi:hypothetical protein
MASLINNLLNISKLECRDAATWRANESSCTSCCKPRLTLLHPLPASARWTMQLQDPA